MSRTYIAIPRILTKINANVIDLNTKLIDILKLLYKNVSNINIPIIRQRLLDRIKKLK